MTIAEIVELMLTCVAFFAAGLARECESVAYSVNLSGQWTNEEIEKLVSHIGTHVELPKRTKKSVFVEYISLFGSMLFGCLGIIISYNLDPLFMIGSFSVFALLQMKDDLKCVFNLISLVIPYIIWGITIWRIV